MPWHRYRRTDPRRQLVHARVVLGRAWRARSDVLFALFALGAVGVGTQGVLVTPSPTVEAAIGASVWAYSLGMVLAGTTALLGMVTGARRVERLGTITIAGLSGLYGVVVLAVTGPGGDQTGTRILISIFALLALAEERWQRGLTRDDIHRLGTEGGHRD